RSQVDHQVESSRLDNRQIGRLCAFENLCRIDADLLACVFKAGSVAHKAAGNGKFAPCSHYRECVSLRQRNNLLVSASKKDIGIDDERTGSFSNEGGEYHLEITFSARSDDNDLSSDCASRFLHSRSIPLRVCIARIDQEPNGSACGYNLM